jgi:trehalose 6-phosphate synthase/phosphatase
MRDAIARCVARPDTDVAVVSGRALEDVKSRIDQSGLILAGNHGLEIAGPGVEPYRHPDIAHYEARAKQLAISLKAIDYEGVWVEQKGASLTLHYRQADHGVHAQIGEVANEMIRDAGFQARDALCAVEARPPIGWDKGHAVLHVLRSRYGPAWSERLQVIYIGDDETDEDAFRALRGLGSTFRVGGADRPTQARRRVSDVVSVQRMLEWLAERPETEAWREFEAGHRQRQLAGEHDTGP